MDEQNVGMGVSDSTNSVETTTTQQATNPVATEQAKVAEPVKGEARRVTRSTGARPSLQEKEEKRAFSRSQFNDIIKRRLDRQLKGIYGRFNVTDEAGLNECVDRLKAASLLEESYNNLKTENSQLKEKNAFISNSIDENRYDDIRTYFKGKELNFSEEALKQELQNHPEWVKSIESPKTTIQALGVDTKAPQGEDDDSKMKRIFGI